MAKKTNEEMTDFTGTTGTYGEASAEEIKQSMMACYKAGMPLNIVGDPGVGKTAIVNAFCRQHNLGEPVCLIGSQMEPQDVVGLPAINETEIGGKKVAYTEYGAPWWQIKIMKGESKVLFLDEFSNSPRTVQAGMLKLVGERLFGNGEKMPKDCAIIMAQNPESTAVDYTEIAAPMANRITFISYAPRDEEVYKGLMGESDWFTEEEKANWSTNEKRWRRRIVDFLRAYNGVYNLKLNTLADGNIDGKAAAFLDPDNLNSDAEREILQSAWPSPRAWDNAARLMSELPWDKEVTPLQNRLLAGTVGREATEYLCDYVHKHSMVDPFDVIKDPTLIVWDVNGENGSTYNEIVEISNAIAAKIHQCDGEDGRPTTEQALQFFEYIIAHDQDTCKGAPVFFVNHFCNSEADTAPGHWLKRHCPDNIPNGTWISRCMKVLVDFTGKNYMRNGEEVQKRQSRASSYNR